MEAASRGWMPVRFISAAAAPRRERERPLADCLRMVPLTGVRCYFIAALTGISLRVQDVEHLFLCCLATRMSFWRNVCLHLLPIFYQVVWVFNIELQEAFAYFGD